MGELSEQNRAVFEAKFGESPKYSTVTMTWEELGALLDAARTEGPGEPVAWLVTTPLNRFVSLKGGYLDNPTDAARWVEQGFDVQPLYASPIREPEISRTSGHDWKSSTLGHGETMCAKCGITNREAAVLGELDVCTKADAILNLAPVGGRGEEGSSRSQPGVSAVQQPASSSALHSDRGEG